jgi:tetratricopeptide (TPR) repeat protein
MTLKHIDRRAAVAVSLGLVFLALLFVCKSPTRLRAQNPVGLSISGRVVDQRGQPQRTLVQLLSQGDALVDNKFTDSNGQFSFLNLPNGAFTVVVEAEGFQPVRQSVVVDQLMMPKMQLNLCLEPAEKRNAQPSPVVSGSASSQRLDVKQLKRPFDPKALHEFNEATSKQREGDDKGAVRHYEKALKIEPDFYPALNNLGALLLRQKDVEGAEAAFRKAQKVNPDDGQAYVNLGHLLYSQSKYDEAVAQLEEGLKLSPGSAAGYFFLGSAYLKMGEWEKAETDLKRASTLDPNGMVSAHLQLANLYLKRHDTAAASSELKAYVQARPSDPQVPAIKKTLASIGVHPPD